MSGLPWYKRDPDAFIRGCADGQLTLEEVGAYTLLIDEMYRRGGPLRDDGRAIAGLLRCDLRVWTRIRSALIRKGKIYETLGMFLSNVRVEQELKSQYDMREKRGRAARLAVASKQQKDEHNFAPIAYVSDSYPLAIEQLTDKSQPSALIPKENAEANAEHLVGRYRVREELPTGVVGSADIAALDEPVAKAMEAYNEAAKRAGWVSARMPIGAQRRRQVRARLKALGGMDGWAKLIAEAEGQPFLGGSNERGWRMDLEFFASERGATRILEGKYRKPGDKPPPSDPVAIHAERIAAFREHGVWNDAWGPCPEPQSKAQGAKP
jgi:uncharacterized protein YdaU (DUF1376 family)